MTLFKQGTRTIEAIVATEDEEKPSQPASLDGSAMPTAGVPAANNIFEKPATDDVFTWQHIQYVVPVSGGERRLLNDVSGYVAPGKLTALMGESGAGKVRHSFVIKALRSTSHRRRHCSMFWPNGPTSELSVENGSSTGSPFPQTSRLRRE